MPPKISSKERILEAATALMWRDGYDAVSVDTICAAANVRKGSFYHVFPSKEDLLNAIILRVWEHDRPEIEAIYSADDPPEVKLRNHLEWFGISQRRLRAKYGFVAGIFNMAVGINAPDSTMEIIRKATQEHVQLIAAAVAQALEPRQLGPSEVEWWGSVVSYLINGVVIDARLTNSLTPFDKLPETVLALLDIGPAPLGLFPKP